MGDNTARDKIKLLRKHGENAIMWDMTSSCWNVQVNLYQEAFRLMEEYKNFHRGTNLLTIPQLTWDLKA